MKKVLMAVVILAGTATMTSCKKDYVCECTYTSGSLSTTTNSTINGTKKDADAACTETATNGGSTWSCKLK